MINLIINIIPYYYSPRRALAWRHPHCQGQALQEYRPQVCLVEFLLEKYPESIWEMFLDNSKAVGTGGGPGPDRLDLLALIGSSGFLFAFAGLEPGDPKSDRRFV